MTNEEYFNIGLPKWPTLVVIGKPVTREQAMEIIIRTDRLDPTSNDPSFERQLNEIVYGVSASSMELSDALKELHGFENWNDSWIFREEKRKEVGCLEDLCYLNNSQILSSWIGGPHGWCQWNGNIETSNYNIGKWPSVEEVYNEWKIIAKAFPFLDLKSQLFGHEAGETNWKTKELVPINPLIEFTIKNGEATMSIPESPLKNPDSIISFDILRPGRERGCTIEQFDKAYNFTKSKIKQVIRK